MSRTTAYTGSLRRVAFSAVVLLFAAQTAAAQQRMSESTKTETSKIRTALAPFYTPHEPFGPPAAAVPGMPSNIDPLVALVLRTMNTYRVQAGLPPYRYDPSLTTMAMAHVHYMLKNCNRAPMAHYELKRLPGYSAAGNEAASTSGLSFGDKSPVGSLVLLAGAYHRMQFLRAGETRIGYGFGISKSQGCSVGLFVTRPPTSRQARVSAGSHKRIVVFPGRGATDLPTDYMQEETPDPRPSVPVGAAGISVRTGYPITISLSYRDAAAFRSADVHLEDAGGHEVPFWESDPTHPSLTTAPNIYAPGVKATSAYRQNFDAVFVMPKKPLRRNMRYTVDARLQIGGNRTHLHWSFTTKPATTWQVRPNAGLPWETLSGALEMASPGDVIRLAPGTYTVTDILYAGNLRIVGSGIGKTRINLRINSEEQFTPIELSGPSVLEGLTLNCPNDIFYATTGSTVLLDNVALSGGNGHDVAVTIEDGSTVVLQNVDAAAFRTYYLVYGVSGGNTTTSSQPATLMTYHLQRPPKLYQLSAGDVDELSMPRRLKSPGADR